MHPGMILPMIIITIVATKHRRLVLVDLKQVPVYQTVYHRMTPSQQNQDRLGGEEHCHRNKKKKIKANLYNASIKLKK